jgi:Uma2 family endonuclease
MGFTTKSATAQVERYRFSVHDIDVMSEAGLFQPEAKLELIDGVIYLMPSPSSEHSGKVNYLSKRCEQVYGDVCIISTQNPVFFSDFDFVLPDIALLHYRDDYYEANHPTGQDVFLIIEVSKTSLDYDKGTKLKLYASQGIREVWIINVLASVVEVYRQPSGEHYLETFTVQAGMPLAPLAFPDKAIVALRETIL